MRQKAERIAASAQRLRTVFHEGGSLAAWLKRPEMYFEQLQALHSVAREMQLELDEIAGLEVDLKYEGYLDRQRMEVERLKKRESHTISDDFAYARVEGLRNEAREELLRYRPPTVVPRDGLRGSIPRTLRCCSCIWSVRVERG